MGDFRAKRAGQRSRTVREDWFAWLPEEMDELFGATRSELECSNGILSVALDEALALCEQEQFTVAKERVIVFAGLFDRLAMRLWLVIRTIEEHGSHFGTLPNVTALDSENFRGTTAQRISFMDNLLAKIVFRGRTRFFHKLHALREIIEELQKEKDAAAQTHRSLEDEMRAALESKDVTISQLQGKLTVNILDRVLFRHPSPPALPNCREDDVRTQEHHAVDTAA